jgi:hypothetical protein
LMSLKRQRLRSLDSQWILPICHFQNQVKMAVEQA